MKKMVQVMLDAEFAEELKSVGEKESRKLSTEIAHRLKFHREFWKGKNP